MPDPTITKRNARYRRKLAAERNWRRVEVFVPAERAEELRAFARSLRRVTRAVPSAEAINDRAKLLYHRLVARRLRHDPSLIDDAKAVLMKHGGDRAYVSEWQALLNRMPCEVRATLISRSPESVRLRLSSPFPLVDSLKIEDENLRRRLWRVAKRGFARSTTSAEPRGR